MQNCNILWKRGHFPKGNEINTNNFWSEILYMHVLSTIDTLLFIENITQKLRFEDLILHLLQVHSSRNPHESIIRSLFDNSIG